MPFCRFVSPAIPSDELLPGIAVLVIDNEPSIAHRATPSAWCSSRAGLSRAALAHF